MSNRQRLTVITEFDDYSITVKLLLFLKKKLIQLLAVYDVVYVHVNWTEPYVMNRDNHRYKLVDTIEVQ